MDSSPDKAVALRCGEPLRLLLEPGTYNCLNLGDVAMMTVAVKRLSEQFPGASIEVVTDDPDALHSHCPTVTPVSAAGRRVWFEEGLLPSTLSRRLPRRAGRSIEVAERSLRRRWPSLLASAMRSKMALRGRTSGVLSAFLDSVEKSDVLVVAGQSALTDHARPHAIAVLELVQASVEKGKPTALFGQGIGPLRDPDVRKLAAAVLPRVDLIALRERQAGQALLDALRVPRDRVTTTGDDAIEPAYRARPRATGIALGVNLRVSPSAAVNWADVERVRPILHAFGREHRAQLLPVPIARDHGFRDPEAIRVLLRGFDDTSDGGLELDTPHRVIEQVGRCRVVVTGAYHAAVFALSQGIPAVCLARSDYFVDKFFGLADQFAAGCEVILLDTPNVEAILRGAIESAWNDADELRPRLLEAAETQIEAGRRAYERFRAGVALRGLPAGAATTRAQEDTDLAGSRTL